LLTAALIPGAAVSVRAANACGSLTAPSASEAVAQSQVVVIGTVAAAGEGTATLQPEVFLKGPASAEPIHFSGTTDECPVAPLTSGARALIYIPDASHPRVPTMYEAWILTDGRASMDGAEQSEADLVAAIRSVTGQYAVPVASRSEGAGIDWGHTVVPLGAALAIVFGIGLVLMRVWHRIDPS